MSERTYRTEAYARYASVHMQHWLTGETPADDILRLEWLFRLQGWLPADRSGACLDLGCGTGHLMGALLAAGYADVKGVDLSPEAVEIARRKSHRVIQADIRDYLHSDETKYTLICASDLIEHFPKDEAREGPQKRQTEQ